MELAVPPLNSALLWPQQKLDDRDLVRCIVCYIICVFLSQCVYGSLDFVCIFKDGYITGLDSVH
jgi:hypothetical protein